MNQLSHEELEQTATDYQKYMVPALFEKWADLILSEVRINNSDRLLDVACGTGIVARKAATRTGGHGYIAGVDINPGMLTVAKKLDPDIDWLEGSAEELPWEKDLFDIVVSQFGLMFFEDKSQALKEMTRVLKPRGYLLVSVLDSLHNIPAYRDIIEVYRDVAGEEVAEALQFPFSMGHKDDLEALCNRSGLVSAEIMHKTVKAIFPDIRSMVLADVKGWFPLSDIRLSEVQINKIVDKSMLALDEYSHPDGSIQFDLPAYLIKYKIPKS